MLTRVFLTFLLCALPIVGFYDTAFIDDPDGYTHIREGKGSNFKIVGTVQSGQVFQYEQDCYSDWWPVLYEGTSGYMHKSRISHFESQLSTELRIVDYDDNIKIYIEIDRFDCTKYKIHKDADRNYVKVNGVSALGTDYGIPIRSVVGVEVYWEDKALVLPEELYADCFNPNPKPDYVYYQLTEDKSKLLIFMSGGDAAGAYTVLWIVEKEGIYSRVLFPHGVYLERL